VQGNATNLWVPVGTALVRVVVLDGFGRHVFVGFFLPGL